MLSATYNALFEDLGAIVKAVNVLQGTAATGADSVKGLRDNLYSTLNGNSTDSSIPGIGQTFDSVADSLVASIQQIADLADVRITDRETILDNLPSSQGTLDEVLRELIRDMIESGQSINQSILTVPATATALGSNVGNGVIHITKTLDASAPSPGWPANVNYKGLDSEMTVSETMTITCNLDSDNDLLPSGQEQFLIEGAQPLQSTWDWRSEGSGVALTVETDNAHTVMANRDMEVWEASGELTNWDSVTGAPGTEFAQESTATHVYRGVSSLKIMGNCVLEQAVQLPTLQPNRLYRLSMWVKTDVASAGTIDLAILSPSDGTAFPAGIQASSISTGAYSLVTGLVMMPANFPSDAIFRLTAATITEDIWVDSISFAPVNYANGVGFSIIAGSTAFNRDDRFTAAVSNVEGVFQKFFRTKYGIQLPSDTVPIQNDLLAT